MKKQIGTSARPSATAPITDPKGSKFSQKPSSSPSYSKAASSTSSSLSSARKQQQLQKNAFPPFQDSLLLQSLKLLKGLIVTVSLKRSEKIYEGLFYEYDHKNAQLIMALCRCTNEGSRTISRSSYKNEMKFPIEHILELSANRATFNNLETTLPPLSSSGSVRSSSSELLTDSLISSSANISSSSFGRELSPWIPDDANENNNSATVAANFGLLDNAGSDGDASSYQVGSWNQFEANEKLFGVKPTFDEDQYTVKLENVCPKREAAAAKIAAEIAAKPTNNPHLSEERTGRLIGDDEEDIYGAVLRTEGGYIPPHLRSAVSPASSSSSSGKISYASAAAKKSQATSENQRSGRNDNVIAVKETKKENSSQQPQSSNQMKSDNISIVINNNRKLSIQTITMSSSVKRKLSMSNHSLALSASNSPEIELDQIHYHQRGDDLTTIQASSSSSCLIELPKIAEECAEKFKEFSKIQKEALQRRKSTLLSHHAALLHSSSFDRAKKIAEFREFSNTFKIKQPSATTKQQEPEIVEDSNKKSGKSSLLRADAQEFSLNPEAPAFIPTFLNSTAASATTEFINHNHPNNNNWNHHPYAAAPHHIYPYPPYYYNSLPFQQEQEQPFHHYGYYYNYPTNSNYPLPYGNSINNNNVNDDESGNNTNTTNKRNIKNNNK